MVFPITDRDDVCQFPIERDRPELGWVAFCAFACLQSKVYFEMPGPMVFEIVMLAAGELHNSNSGCPAAELTIKRAAFLEKEAPPSGRQCSMVVRTESANLPAEGDLRTHAEKTVRLCAGSELSFWRVASFILRVPRKR